MKKDDIVFINKKGLGNVQSQNHPILAFFYHNLPEMEDKTPLRELNR